MFLSNITLLVIYSEVFIEEEKCKMRRTTNPQLRLHHIAVALTLYSGEVKAWSVKSKKLKIWPRSRQVLENLFLVLVFMSHLGSLLDVFISILATKT